MSEFESTCFNAHYSKNKLCQKSDCRYWHDLKCNQNCIINKINENQDMTLQDIGDLFNITRMRVCQIEKHAIKKLKNKIKLSF